MQRLKRNLRKPRRPRARTRAQSAAPRAKDLAAIQIAKKAAFIAALRKRSSVLHAAERAGLSASWCYAERRRDPDGFGQEWDDAITFTTEILEDSLFERAVGINEPVYQGGRLVGHVRRASDAAAIFLLRARRPDVYRERVEHLGLVGQNVYVNVAIDRLSISDLETVITILSKVAYDPKDAAKAIEDNSEKPS